jgi:MFS family permease
VETPATPAPARAGNRSALAIVFLVVFIDLLGFGIVLPLLPLYGDSYIKPLVGGDESSGLEGAVLGLLMASFSLMQFFLAPVWGRLSDRVGRRPVLLAGLAGSVCFYLLFGYASGLPVEQAGLALALLFAARVGAGAAGATIGTAQAVIADCTSPENRRRGMALIGAAFGVGFTFGPLFGFASLLLFPDYRAGTGVVAAALSLAALLLGLALLPETRRFAEAPPAPRRGLDFSALRIALATPAIAPVVLVFFLVSVGFAAFEVTLALLNRDALRLAERDNFLVFAYVGFVLLATQGGLNQVLMKKFDEVTMMTLGLSLLGLGVGSLGGVAYLAGQGGEGFGALLGAELAALAMAVVGFAFLTPSAQALISRRADPARQGEILGVNQSASALARIVGPVVGLTLYKLTSTHLLPYLFGAALLLLMLPLMPRIRRGG